MSEFSKGYETRRRPDRTFFDPAFSSNYWIYGSIAISWGIGLLPLTEWPFFPNLLVMTLVFWGIYQPQKIYYWLAFLLGLPVDTDSAAVFGQNSLAFCLVVFCAEAMSQRLQWLQPVGQAINILPVFMILPILLVIESFCFGSLQIDWGWFTRALMGVVLWPAWCFILTRRFISLKS